MLLNVTSNAGRRGDGPRERLGCLRGRGGVVGPRFTAPVVIALVILLGVAGCGGSGAKSTTAKSTAVAASTSPTTTQAAATNKSPHPAKPASHKATKTTSAGHSGTTTHPTTTTTTKRSGTTSSSPKPPAPQGPVGPLHASFTAQDHAPVINQPWPYTVTATDGRGQPLSGTVNVEFLFGGQVVGRDTPATRPITNGRWHDNLKFPPPSLGIPLIVRAIVHTQVGSATFNWPVKVKR
jgi:hypothetical protein